LSDQRHACQEVVELNTAFHLKIDEIGMIHAVIAVHFRAHFYTPLKTLVSRVFDMTAISCWNRVLDPSP
jgi:hypothetical protein